MPHEFFSALIPLKKSRNKKFKLEINIRVTKIYILFKNVSYSERGLKYENEEEDEI